MRSKDHLSTKEAAAILGVSEKWLRRRRQDRSDGPDWYKLSGKKIVYSREIVLSWLENHRNGQ